MTSRIPLDDLTSDQLDALYQRAEHADAVTAETKRLLTRRTTTLRQRAERAEAAIERARAAVHVVDRDDVTDWQRGYRACSTVALGALDGQPGPAATAGRRLTEEQADAARAAHIPPGTVITETVVAEAMRQLGTTAAGAVQRAIRAQQQDFALTGEQPGPAATEATEQLDAAYRERAHLVALLAAMTPGAVIAPADDIDEPGWQIAYLTVGGRQASWHVHPRDADLFAAVENVDADDPRAQWDGHTTDEKYSRIAALSVDDPLARQRDRGADRTPSPDH